MCRYTQERDTLWGGFMLSNRPFLLYCSLHNFSLKLRPWAQQAMRRTREVRATALETRLDPWTSNLKKTGGCKLGVLAGLGSPSCQLSDCWWGHVPRVSIYSTDHLQTDAWRRTPKTMYILYIHTHTYIYTHIYIHIDIDIYRHRLTSSTLEARWCCTIQVWYLIPL